MKTISSFPKIFHVGENYIPNLFNESIEITEKIDGSQWCFGVNKNNELVMRSKGEDLTDKPVPGMFEIAKKQSERCFEILTSQKLKDIYFYCEYVAKPKHNILTYERIPINNLYLFGVRIGENFITDTKFLIDSAEKLNIEPPNILLLKRGKPDEDCTTMEELTALLETDSVLGGEKIEGIVIKNYIYPAILKGHIIPISMGKYVSEKFKEKHKTEWKGTYTSKGKLEMLIGSYQSNARFDKAIQHLREKNELENAPKDIGKLMPEIVRDLLEEEESNMKEQLFGIFKNDILRRATAGFPEYYKQKLIDSAFERDEKAA